MERTGDGRGGKSKAPGVFTYGQAGGAFEHEGGTAWNGTGVSSAGRVWQMVFWKTFAAYSVLDVPVGY